MPESKPKYKEIKPGQADPQKPGRWDAKIDGASLNYLIEGGKPIRAFSYRPSVRGEALIQHTFRIPNLSGKKAPKGIKKTILRGEVYTIDPRTKRAVKAHELGGILNSNVIKSRGIQKSKGKLINTIFDIVKFDGKDVSSLSTEEKRKLIKEVLARPGIKGLFHTPPSATTPKAKQALFDKIRKGQLKQTKEGIIIHSPEGVMTKVKFKPEWDVKISGIFTKPRSEAKGMAGGFTYRVVDGKKIRRKSRVGTGFSHELRRAMLENPEDFIGVIAKVTGLEQHISGAIRAPSFQGWHLDKNDPDRIPEIKR
jgi:ATP-dependent DNA ligase